MSFTITHRSGAMERDPSAECIDALIAELGEVDPEHPDIAISDESGWTLSAFPDGRVFWENVEGDDAPARSMRDVQREHLRHLFGQLADGDLAAVDFEPWEPSA
jgi:hypothetical protein